MENRNVFLFGAGVSAAADIPLLGGFIDRMLEISLRGRTRGAEITQTDAEILKTALEVRERLDGYHGRVAFNDRNIEDILSILSMSASTGNEDDRKRFSAFVNAIARTIDLECSVPHSQIDRAEQPVADGIYGKFWRSIIDIGTDGAIPTIISLNYDLVLERSLLGSIPGTYWSRSRHPLRFNGITVRYLCETFEEKCYQVDEAQFWGKRDETLYGYTLKEVRSSTSKPLIIEILKLHGSLNFPRNGEGSRIDIQATQSAPLIVPPVFVKVGEKSLEPIWARAMQVLRNAINIVVCGYSLPVSDTYMQYFLKAALGPNKNLSKVAVFDPALRLGGESTQAMRDRYSEVFSHQLRKRVDFAPVGAKDGTFSDLVEVLSGNSSQILFGPT